jgi:hypothetical protein
MFLLSMVFGLLSWFLGGGFIRISAEDIFLNTLHGKYRIFWDEVRYIETNGVIFAFCGDDKRVVVMLTPIAVTNRSRMLKAIETLASRRKIEIRSGEAIPLTQSGSRV